MPVTPAEPASLRVLFVVPYVPSPLRTRPFNLIRQLARRGHRIVLFCIATTSREARAAERLREWCERVEVVRIGRARALGNCLAALWAGHPLQARYCDSPRMRALVREAVRFERPGRMRAGPAGGVDIVHVEHLRAVRFVLDLPTVPRVYDSVDCISLLLERAARAGPTPGARLRSWIELGRTRRFESDLLTRFDRILVAAARDGDALIALRRDGAPPGRPGSGTVTVVANGVDFEHFRADGRPRDAATLLFLGRLGYHANEAAARRLVDEIMPRVWARRPEARVVLAGADPPRSLRALARRHRPRVEVTGYVPDVRPWLARATVSVNPLRYAVGMQNKVLEAMAMEVPVVATSEALGGLEVEDGAPLVVADEPDVFAQRVVALLDDPDRCRRLGAAGRAYVARHHGWTESAARLEDVYRAEMARGAAGGPVDRAGTAPA